MSSPASSSLLVIIASPSRCRDQSSVGVAIARTNTRVADGGVGSGHSTEPQVPYPTQGRFQRDESSQTASGEGSAQKSLVCLALPCAAAVIVREADHRPWKSVVRSPAEGIVWRHTPSNLLHRAKCALGRAPRCAPGLEVLARFRSRPIFDSPEDLNSGVSDDDTQPPSSNPIRQQARGAGSQRREIETWDRIAPGGLALWACTGLAGLRPWNHAPSLRPAFFAPRHADKMNEYGGGPTPRLLHMGVHMHMQPPWALGPGGPHDQSRTISSASASMQRGSQWLGRTPGAV